MIIDYEHGPFEIGRTSDYVNACLSYGCSQLFVSKNSDWMSLQVLDQGAHGCNSWCKGFKTVDTFIDKIKYAPIGRRGFCHILNQEIFES